MVTWIPSVRNSPWMRGARHNGFAAALLSTKARIVAVTLGRPGPDGFERRTQRRRSHWRCHRSTVSGRTSTKAMRHSRHLLASRIQKSRSLSRSCGRLTVRFKAVSC